MSWVSVAVATVAAGLADDWQTVRPGRVVEINDPGDRPAWRAPILLRTHCPSCGAPAERYRCSYCLTPSETA